MIRWLFAAIRRWSHKPHFYEIEIAWQTGETTIEVRDRLAAVAMSTPYSLLDVAAAEMARLEVRPDLTLVEMLDLCAAQNVAPRSVPE